MKNVFPASFAAGTLAVVGVLGSAQAQSVRGPVALTIELSPVADQAGRHQGKIAVTVTNNSSQVARVPTYQLPLKSLDNGILEVSRDGKPVDYIGRLVKCGLPKATDFTILQPGQSAKGEVDLAGAYDLSTSGNYTIQVRSVLQYASFSDGSLMKAANGEPAVATSTPITVWLDGARRGVQRQLSVGPTAVVNGINYLNCSTTRTSQAGTAVTAARNYLNAGSTGARYTTWFGTYNALRYSRVSSNFVNIDNALDQNNGQLRINCSCEANLADAYATPMSIRTSRTRSMSAARSGVHRPPAPTPRPSPWCTRPATSPWWPALRTASTASPAHAALPKAIRPRRSPMPTATSTLPKTPKRRTERIIV
ncbi:peptidase [Xanthomonas oryzae pv. oryzae]|nr:peptidase [Xanthomonas oryzae pv. oryzae]